MSAQAVLPPQTPRQHAERITEQNYYALESEVIRTVGRRLAARNMRLDASDLEEAYCLAWQGVWEKISAGAKVANLTGMLVEVTWRRAVDSYREMRPSQHADVDVADHVVEVDLDGRLDDHAKLQRFIQRLKGRLNQRECEAVSLCLIHGYTRPEARVVLGIDSEERMQKLMDGATRKIGGIVESINARGCGGDEWARMMRSYALGTLAEGDRDYQRAEEHIEGCAACRRYVMGLRGLAAVIPPIGVPLLHITGGIFAFLARLLRGHGSANATSGTLQTAAAGGSAAGGGAGVAGSLSTVKVAAVLVAAAASAGAVAVSVTGVPHHRHGTRHVHVARSAPAFSRTGSAASAGAVGARESASSTARATTHSGGGSGRVTAVEREFGIEGEHIAQTASAPTARHVSASSASTAPSSPQVGSSAGSVEKEFGPER
jgi:DNA-directed RNA polymerase specialized sigma24 family protein